VTPDFLRQGAPAAVLRALPGARAVGGAVRDHLAGRTIHDVDVAVALPPEEVSRRLGAAGLKVFETGLKHGTVTAVLDRQPVEVTTLRRDVLTDGRHAEVEWTDDWREDAARRDFTINAMSMGADGVLHDFFGGAADLAAGRVRFVGDAGQRLAEDFLRALRFFRFWARYGQGEPDAAAVSAIRQAVPGLARLSAERVWMELKRLLAAEDPRAALRLMAQTGVLGAVLPEVPDAGRLDILLAWEASHGRSIDVMLRVAALLPVGTDLAGLAARLRLSRDEAEQLAALHDLRDVPGPEAVSWPAHRLREARARIRARTQRTNLGELSLIRAVGHPGDDHRAQLERLDTAPGPDFPLQGRDALDLGIAPGPTMGRLLHEAREWWLADGAGAGRDACLAKLRELANPPPG